MDMSSLTIIKDFLAHFPQSVTSGNDRDEMILNFWTQIEKIETQSTFQNKIQQTQTPLELIDLVKPYFNYIPSTTSTKDVVKKSGSKFKKYLNKSVNLTHTKKDIRQAFKMGNLAIAYADNGDDLACAFYNRSEILYTLNDPLSALKDFDLSLFHSSEEQKQEFEDSAKKTISKYQTLLEKKTFANPELAKKCSEEKTKRNLFYKNLFTIKSPNLMAPSLEDFIQIKFSQDKGRHLMATRDVPIGTTLLVEKPFVKILEGTLDLKTGSKCHHCHRLNVNCIPCPSCVFAFFCDTHCLKEASNYHQYECPCLPDLSVVLSNERDFDEPNFYLAFKTICTVGPEKLFQNFEQNNFQKYYSGPNNESDLHDPLDYSQVCHLSSSFKPNKILYPLTALILANILRINTNFFDEKTETKFFDFVAGMILHHFECYRGSSQQVMGLSKLDGIHLENTMATKMELEELIEPQVIGRGVHVTKGLLNHSCNPNIVQIWDKKNGQCAIISLKSIQKGEELLLSYGPTFWKIPKSQRQNKLNRTFNFNCDCIPCQENWPAIFSLISMHRDFTCAKCCSNLKGEEKGPGKISKFLLNSENNFNCPTCQTSYNQREVEEEFERQLKLAKVCKNLILANSPLQVIEKLKNNLEYFENNVMLPSDELYGGQELFCTAINLIVHYAQ